MWQWLVGIFGLWAAKKALDALSDPGQARRKTSSRSVAREHQQLVNNLRRLRKELRECSSNGRIALLGQPGSGKSSLLFRLTKGACDPKPVISQKTDATDWSRSGNVRLLTRWRQQIYVDTPGYDTRRHKASIYIEHFPFTDTDVVVLVLSGKLHA
ncbi:MAG: hypothetical protein D6815_08870, partial [Candidatus Dadabacteria bacterium]